MHVSLSNAALYCNCPAQHLSTENHGFSPDGLFLTTVESGIRHRMLAIAEAVPLSISLP
jgi:hypothetical protein